MQVPLLSKFYWYNKYMLKRNKKKVQKRKVVQDFYKTSRKSLPMFDEKYILLNNLIINFEEISTTIPMELKVITKMSIAEDVGL